VFVGLRDGINLSPEGNNLSQLLIFPNSLINLMLKAERKLEIWVK